MAEYTSTDVTAILEVFDLLITSYRYDQSPEALEEEVSDEELMTATKTSHEKISSILEAAGIEDPDFMENDFEELLPEGFDLNNDGKSYWLS